MADLRRACSGETAKRKVDYFEIFRDLHVCNMYENGCNGIKDCNPQNSEARPRPRLSFPVPDRGDRRRKRGADGGQGKLGFEGLVNSKDE